ncbi:hypothetical protein BKA56DRAFT_623086 [Ilyonectria sp. MPI-CAGE-AT-0026]|nr:hypothetical protein BKA56DRAFT_623086 [Ilyonectria sp. MPI-CAGE-AT-0026]
MEAISGAAAVLQLVQLLGNTVMQTTQAYTEIRGIEETLRDFDGQLNATGYLITNFERAIQRDASSDMVQSWWEQSDVEGLLGGFQRTYHRLNAIFTEISRERSSAVAVRTYIKMKRYDSDIHHLRLCINTYTSALQVPVLIREISSTYASTHHAHENEVVGLLEKLDSRMADLENSMARAQQNHLARSLDMTTEVTAGPSTLEGTEDTLRGLKEEIPNLAMSQEKEVEVASVAQQEKPMAEMELRIEIAEETNSMLDTTKRLVAHAKSYASTVDCASMTSGTTYFRYRNEKKRPAKNDAVSDLVSIPEFDHLVDIGIPMKGKQRETIASWAHDVEFDTASSLSLPSTVRSPLGQSLTTASRSTSGLSSVATSSGLSLVDEMHQRRLRKAESLMKTKLFEPAIPHLIRLLSESTDPDDARQRDILTQWLAKAVVETQPVGQVADSVCQRFPDVRNKLDEARLEMAEKFLEEKSFANIVQILAPYDQTSLDPDQPDSTGDVTTTVNLRIVLCTAMMQCEQSANVIPILTWVLKQHPLQRAQEGAAHTLLAEAHSNDPPNWEVAKAHGMRGVEANMDVFGRDHASTLSSMALMANICCQSTDPDEELWREMIPTSQPDLSVPVPAEIRDRLQSCLDEMEKLGIDEAANLALHYLKSNFVVAGSITHSCSHEVCWDCIKVHMLREGNPLLAFEDGVRCSNHTIGDPTTRAPNPTGEVFPRPQSTQRQVLGLSPLHFLAIARPISGMWPGRKTQSCVEEIASVLKLAKPDTLEEVVNRCICDTWKISMNALWWAVVYGRKEVVDFFASLEVTKKAEGAKILSMPWKLPDGDSSRYEESIMTAFNTLSMEEAYQVVIAPSGSRLPWCFEQLSMLPKFVKQCGKEVRDLQFPSSTIKGQFQPLINIAVNCSMTNDIDHDGGHSDSLLLYVRPVTLPDLMVLKALLELKADPNVQDTQNRTAMDIIVAGIAKSMSFWSEHPAGHTTFNYDLSMLQILLENGGNLNKINRAKLEGGLRTKAGYDMVEEQITQNELHWKNKRDELLLTSQDCFWACFHPFYGRDVSALESRIQNIPSERKWNKEKFELSEELKGLLPIVESAEGESND